ncbi:MAG TPA: ABC transporter permease [Chryseosolibacter sp.]|nr:ABC transporter permease [Chryseosolibacter sp.]
MQPPKRALQFLRWFCREDCIEEIEGDLNEMFRKNCQTSPRTAGWKFTWRVLRYFRPEFMKPFNNYQSNALGMYKSYFSIGWRNVIRNRGYSLINAGGLAIGMMVAIFIGLWVYDELSFNKYHRNYESIGQVWSFHSDPATSIVDGDKSMQYPVGATLRNNYGQYFKHVLMAWWPGNHTVAVDDKVMLKNGLFVEPGALEMLSLNMIRGSYKSLDEPHSVVLSRSTAEVFFGDEDPINKTVRLNGRMDAVVTGVYEDIPRNSNFGETQFFAPWDLWLSVNEWARRQEADWDNHPINIYVQLQPNVSMEEVNAAMKELYRKNMPADFYKTQERFDPFVQIIPMSTWHLYGNVENGKPAGGRITYVWLFAVVGVFVLVLACINFVNLSTARSEKRSKEVGVRKVVGSRKGQLIAQFLTESLVVVVVSFLFAMIMVGSLLPWFNRLTDKDTTLPLFNPVFWAMSLAFIVLTAMLAGVYPAFYLSSFQPVKVLKGVFRSGHFAALPRKVLVVVQFTTSVILIIGTIVVYQQIQFARNRPVGYQRSSLITVHVSDPAFQNKLDVIRNELRGSGVVAALTASSGPLTAIWNTTNGYEWKGKDPNMDASFAICNITTDFGETVGWEIVAGRDFSKEISTDSTEAIILNEAAVEYMGLKDPVGQEFTDVNEFGQKKWTRTIIGVVKNMVMESPYEPVRQTLYFYNPKVFLGLMHIRIDPNASAADALTKIKSVFNKNVPMAGFDYTFVDEEYARKFAQEERIGVLAGIFSSLAIFICCLGLFGLASYVAEQRTKEIGIRKVMGASVAKLWQLLSKDFMILVIIACLVACPLGYYLMTTWLLDYDYRTEVSLWVFVLTVIGAVLVTLLTVSFHAIRAALANPVKSLRSE